MSQGAHVQRAALDAFDAIVAAPAPHAPRRLADIALATEVLLAAVVGFIAETEGWDAKRRGAFLRAIVDCAAVRLAETDDRARRAKLQ